MALLRPVGKSAQNHQLKGSNMKSATKYGILVMFLFFGLIGAFRLKVTAATQKSSPTAANSGAVSVFATCNDLNGPCTAQAFCPASKTVRTGIASYIVPDSKGAAYGICGTGSIACQVGAPGCTTTSAAETGGCGSPGWNRQVVSVSINCQ